MVKFGSGKALTFAHTFGPLQLSGRCNTGEESSDPGDAENGLAEGDSDHAFERLGRWDKHAIVDGHQAGMR
jgi:hypothetical protein